MLKQSFLAAEFMSDTEPSLVNIAESAIGEYSQLDSRSQYDALDALRDVGGVEGAKMSFGVWSGGVCPMTPN